MSRALRVHPSGGIGCVELGGPDTYARLSGAVLDELEATLDHLWADTSCTGIVLHGGGNAFATGAEIAEVHALTSASAFPFARRAQQLFEAIARGPKPVVAAISGYCLGGAFDLALACWCRVATSDAVFRHPGTSLGLLTGWGGTQRLTRLLGRNRALALLLTGNTLTGTEARQLGLVDLLVPPEHLLAAAETEARRFARHDRVALSHALRC